MKFFASILLLYFFFLQLQPVIYPVHAKEEKVMSCCVKMSKEKKGSKEHNNDCCDKNNCNPFMSQCPLCMANAIVVKQILFPQRALIYNIKPVFFSENTNLTVGYDADILRPPQVV